MFQVEIGIIVDTEFVREVISKIELGSQNPTNFNNQISTTNRKVLKIKDIERQRKALATF